jgi:hypothetical protein
MTDVDKGDDLNKLIDIGADFVDAANAFSRALKPLSKDDVELAICAERVQRGQRYEYEIPADQLERFRRLAQRLDAQFVVVPTFDALFRIAMWWDDSGRCRAFRPTTH